MKKYVKEAVKELLDSDKLKIEITLEKEKDYKKNPLRIFYNKLIFALQTRFVPSHFKNWLMSTTGMNVGHDVCIPHYIKFDGYFPELIHLEKGCLVGGGSTFITHELKGNKLILGKNILQERTLIGGLSVMRPGSVIGKHCILNLNSELEGKTGEGELWLGRPAKVAKKFTSEEVDKYFKPSNGQYKEYYREFRKQVKEFFKDPTKNYFKIHYNGKRLNAGDDWWRARNIFRIFYNGAIVELCCLLPPCFLKTLLLKMVGVKIGKKVKIGRGVVFDHLFPDTITLEDNVILEKGCYLDGHSYTISQTIFGKTLIKKEAHLKENTFVGTGTTIGEKVIIEANSGVEKVVPDNEVWGGIPAKFIRKREKD